MDKKNRYCFNLYLLYMFYIIILNDNSCKILYVRLGIRLTLRGKAHTEWKISKAGETRTVKDDEYYIDEKKILWGRGKYR